MKKATKKREEIRIWIARDNVLINKLNTNTYGLFLKKPKALKTSIYDYDKYSWNDDGIKYRTKHSIDEIIRNLCPEWFERMTKFKLKPGECVHVLWNASIVPVPAAVRKPRQKKAK